MSSYIFELSNYHAVKEAKIKIDGITVLAGQNGSGKSTVSRWLHHVVYTLNKYDSMVESSGIRDVSLFLDRMERALFSVVGYMKAREFASITDMISENGISTVAQTTEYYENASNLFMSFLKEHFQGENGMEDFHRIGRFFQIEPDEHTTRESFIEKLRIRLDTRYQEILDRVCSKKRTHTVDTFSEKIFSIVDYEIEDSEIEFGLSEDGIELISESEFKFPLMLRNVVYIDTHKIGQALSASVESDLAMMLATPLHEVNDSARVIARMIQQIIGGEVQVVGESQRIRNGKFRFISKDGRSFNLKGAATGIISFSYILQLLQNGWINEDSLLIIDEPESHLHPQWVVEYARVLVMIHKLIGAKIVISSHNPDMVSAIESISRKEGLESVTRFYLSEKIDENTELYEFRDLGFEISDIFDSFNIALDRITFYGDTCE